ncbi:MAG: IrrE N-terminal-like domain [Chitinophagaceae bacterium]|nr:IrrE N-terminal-like domain [Chitinophagaceae bacterium]
MKKPDLEKEANLFAMLLLMPSKFIKEDLKDGITIADDKRIKELAKKYDVSITAMALRISYFFKHNY